MCYMQTKGGVCIYILPLGSCLGKPARLVIETDAVTRVVMMAFMFLSIVPENPFPSPLLALPRVEHSAFTAFPWMQLSIRSLDFLDV